MQIPSSLSLMTVEHLSELRDLLWEVADEDLPPAIDGEDGIQIAELFGKPVFVDEPRGLAIVRLVTGWREIAWRRIDNKLQFDACELSLCEWECFDMDCIKRGLKPALRIIEAVAKELQHRNEKQLPKELFGPQDADEDCEGETWMGE